MNLYGTDPLLAAMTEQFSAAAHAASRVEVRPALKTVVAASGPSGLLFAVVASQGGAEEAFKAEAG